MIIPILLLISLGVAVIYSSSQQLAIQQAVFALLGLGAFFLLRNFDYKALRPLIIYFYILTILSLIIVMILGLETRGSVRWISLGPFNFQPSEFAKISLILILADFWSKNLPKWKNIGLSLLFFLPLGILVFRQPDLGTTLTLLFIWFSILFAASISFIKLSLIIFISVVSTPISWFLMKD